MVAVHQLHDLLQQGDKEEEPKEDHEEIQRMFGVEDN
jgi:hypothetical protein